MLLAQKWAERKRSLLVILPANLRKLLASSTRAISGTLERMVHRLRGRGRRPIASFDGARPRRLGRREAVDALDDEWRTEDIDGGTGPVDRNRIDRSGLERELADLREFHALASSITINAKGEVLLTALSRGFEAATRRRS
jgi:hypothetical protein